MKIHNPSDLNLNSQTLRALARGELDPIKQAVEDHRREKAAARKASLKEAKAKREKPAAGGKQGRRQPKEKKQALVRSGAASVAESSAEIDSAENGRAENDGTENNNTRLARNSSADPDVNQTRRQAEYENLLQKRSELIEIIRGCEALEVMSFERLALKDYPEGIHLAAAKRRRDLWLLCCLFCGAVFILGWLNLIPVLFAGIAFGLLVILGALILAPFRKLIFELPTPGELKATRKAMEFQALKHIKMLEGSHGLASQCQLMSVYGPRLQDKRFQRIVLLSKQGQIVKAIRSVAGIRLYLSYLLEAQQAFVAVKQGYMKTSTTLKRDYIDLAAENA